MRNYNFCKNSNSYLWTG